MNEDMRHELEAMMEERAAFYRLLSSIYFKEVSEEFIRDLRALPMEVAQEEGMLGQGFRDLRAYLSHQGPDPRTDLATDYARIFLAAGMFSGDAGCPFESIYTSEEKLVMQEARDEVRALYRSHGMAVDEALHLPEDHLSFELEFMALLSDKARAAAEADDMQALVENVMVQEDFVERHLQNWLPSLAERVADLARYRFYPAMMSVTRGYIEQDRALLQELRGSLLVYLAQE